MFARGSAWVLVFTPLYMIHFSCMGERQQQRDLLWGKNENVDAQTFYRLVQSHFSQNPVR